MIKTLNNIKYNNQTLGLFIMAETFMSSLAEMAKNGNNDNANSLNISNIFLQVTDISNDHADITYATGVNLITGENTKVRLSNIDESANDLVAMKKENNPVNAKHTITRLYTGQKPREELIAKRDKRRANYLFFDRCFSLGHQNGYATYRSHWANTISQQATIETVTGYVNIQYKNETHLPNGKIRAWANVLEFCRFFTLEEKAKNFEMIKFALRQTLAKTNSIMREGRFQAEIVDANNNAVANFNIPQKYVETNGCDSSGRPSTYMAPTDPQDSISTFLMKDGKGANTFSVSKDIARIVLNVFCDYPYRQDDFISNDTDYIQNLEKLKTQLLSGELRVKVFGCRVYRFGREQISELAPRERFNPLKIFSREIYDSTNMPTGTFEQLFVPMLLVMQVAETGRRFIVFHNRIHYDTLGIGKPKSLKELSDDLDKVQPLKTKSYTL